MFFPPKKSTEKSLRASNIFAALTVSFSNNTTQLQYYSI